MKATSGKELDMTQGSPHQTEGGVGGSPPRQRTGAGHVVGGSLGT